MNDSEILADAYSAVYERDADDSFNNIALMWSLYFDTTVTPADVAYAMILLKVCRRINGRDDDDLPTDIAGYAENAARHQ